MSSLLFVPTQHTTYVTPLSYKHIMLEDIRTGRPPLLPRPVLVHQQMKFTSFNYFAASLIDVDKGLRYFQAFGTDGDTNLSDALSHSFPFATVLRCFSHFERNLYEKLCELNVPKRMNLYEISWAFVLVIPYFLDQTPRLLFIAETSSDYSRAATIN